MSQYVTMTTICTWWFWHLLLWHWSCQPTASVLAGPWGSDKRRRRRRLEIRKKKKKTRNTGNRKNKFVDADCRRSIWSSGDDRNHRAHRKVPAAAPQDCCVWCFLSLTMLSKVVFSCNLHCNKKYDITSSYLTSFYTFISTLLLIGCNLMQFADCVTLSSLLLKGNQVLATCRSRWDLNLLELILNWSWGKGSINAQSSPVCSFVLVCFSLAPDLKHDHRSAHLQREFFSATFNRWIFFEKTNSVTAWRSSKSQLLSQGGAWAGWLAAIGAIGHTGRYPAPAQAWTLSYRKWKQSCGTIYVTVSHRIDSISH